MKIKSKLILIILLLVLTVLLTVKGSNIISKQSMQVLSSNIHNPLDEKKECNDTLNNKSLSFEKAIRNGDVVKISYFGSVSSKTHNETEVYNINKLDEFMENTKRGKNDKIRIVKYAYDNRHTWVNKLYDLEYNGEKIKETVYDVYSNPKVFIPSEPYYSDKIIKRDYPNDIWYGTCLECDEGDNCASLISFEKSSIVN